MRKILNIICVLALSLLLSGCGNKEDGGLSHNFMRVPDYELPALTESESLEMASYMSGGRAYVSGGRLYCMGFDEEYEPVLASLSLEGGEPGDFRILKKDCVPEYLKEYQGRLYFINSRNNKSLECINTDGSGEKIIKEGPCDFLQIRGDKLCFCDGSGRLRSMAADGSAEQTVLPEACFYPYIIGDTLIYQRASDEHLHMLELLSGRDTELTDMPSYAPLIWGDKLFCSVKEGVYTVKLDGREPLKLKISGLQGAAQYYLSGTELFITGTIEHQGLQGFSIRAAEPEESLEIISSGSYRLLEYAGEELSIFSEYEAGGRFRQLLILDSEGNECRFFPAEEPYK